MLHGIRQYNLADNLTMSLIGRLKRRLAKGVAVRAGSLQLELRASRVTAPSNAPPGPDIDASYVRALEARFPALREFQLDLRRDTAPEILEFYLAYIPLIHAPAHGAHLRTILARLREHTKDDGIRAAATRAIAISDLKDGLPERGLCLRDDDTVAEKWAQEVQQFEEHYGAPIITEDWLQSSRGASIVHYFEAHKDLLRDKDIMHFGPEREVQSWIEENKSRLGIRSYFTVDGIQPQFDARYDITDIRVPSESYDVILCHRVMEHVSDDKKGFSELFRVLRPGGLLNFSVPSAPQRAHTAEWIIADASHHGHVRQYGRDLEQRMEDAGFSVTLELWLCKQPAEALRACNAYPLRMYNARRPRA